MALDTTQDATTADHLVILIHGLWGNPVHLKQLYNTLATARGRDGLYIHIPKSNADNHTYDGIEVGGERITNEIEGVLQELGPRIKKISVIGYSLGGLVARYVVGLLYKNGVFDNLQPMNFTTFATPHLGVRTPKLGYRAQTWNFLGSRTLSTSGQQMFLADSFRDTGRPLLSVMADPTSIFVKGLAMFKKKSLYANTMNDRSVPFYTAAISRVDPYVDLEKVDVHPLPSHPVILDPACPVSPRKTQEEQAMTMTRTVAWAKESVPFYAFLVAFVPLAVPLFMVNAGYQTYKSAQRVRLHEAGSVFDLKKYRIPLLEESQAVQDRVVERLATREGEEYLPTPPPEESPMSSSTTLGKEEREVGEEREQVPWPTLALTMEQFEMIDNLDEVVRFEKFHCHIQKVRHTHAAIVVRMDRESFGEGRMVGKHWAEGFLA